MTRDRAREEFEQFVSGSVDDLLRTAYLVAWDVSAAEDLVQECLFRVAQRWPRVRSMDFPKAYARRILINLALDGSKRRQRHQAELGREDRMAADRHDQATARSLGMVETNAELNDALGQLAPRQRAVLVLRYFEDLTEAQVAEAMGCSVGTVKSTASRALLRLRLFLSPGRLDDSCFYPDDITKTKGVTQHDPATRN